MLTWFDWGEYAIWFLSPRIKVSMDGRRETVYSDRVLSSHLAVYYGWDGWQDELRRIGPDHIWMPKSLATVDQLETLGWRPVLTTGQSIVFSKTAAPLPAWDALAQPCFPGAP